MDVNLPPKLVRFVEHQVATGRYSSADEVLADAVRHLQETLAPDPEDQRSLAGDALRFAAQSQRDAMDLLAQAAGGGDIREGLAEYSNSVMRGTLDLIGRVPVARDVEQRVRTSLDAISTGSNRSADQAKLVRQGLEATARLWEVSEQLTGVTYPI